MANDYISQVTLPNNTTYDISVPTDKVYPFEAITYPAYTCSANDANKGVLFFGKINITDYDPWQTPWSIHYRIYVTTSNANMQGWYDCHFSIQGSTVTWYNYNNFYSTSYRPIYHHRLLYPKSGYSQYGGYFGVRVQSANEVTTTARFYKIEVLETKNCTIELLPAIKRFDEIYITTNNIAASTIWNNTDYNGTDVGLQESGDANSNTYDRTYMSNNKKARVAIAAGSICVGDSNGYAGIDNGVEFDIAYPILYQPTAIAANGQRSDFYLYYPSITSTVNTTDLTHIANGILYMTGTLSGTTFTCNSKILTYTVPTIEDGIIYIPVAINTNATTQSLYFLGGIAHLFWYKDGAFREYNGRSIKSITRSGTTFTATRDDGSSFTFTQQDNNTIYSAGTGLSLGSGNVFNHASSITAGTAGTSSATSGASIAIPYVTYNATGHITATGTHTHTISAADLGLAKAMRLIGVATVAITDGSTTDPVISGYSTKTAGDVIIDKDSSREYVWSTTDKWELLGGDESYWVSSTDTAAKFWRGDNTWSDTIDGGLLKIKNNTVTVSIGSTNSSWVHFTNDKNVAFYFGNGISINGDLNPYGTTSTRNFGSSSAYWNNGYITAIHNKIYNHLNSNAVNDGSWGTGTRGVKPTATTTDGNTTYSGAVVGTSILNIGNNKIGANSSSGVDDNAQGYLRLYSSGSAYGELTAYTTSSKTHVHATNGISFPENTINIMFRPGSGSYYTHVSYQTSGNEALVSATQNAVTSFIFVNGESYANIASDRWTKLTGASGAGNAPGLQIKQNCVSIGELIPSGTNATYKLNVNGTSNFKGKMTSTGSFYTSGHHISLISGGEADQFIDFAYAADPIASTAPGASWRIGALNSGSGDSNYFVIQTGGSATSATTWNNALRLGMNTYDAGFGGNVYPLTNNSKTLGTSSLKWNNVYATTFTGNLTGNATSADSAKWLMNRGGSTVTISDGPWAHGQTGSGGTNAATVWHQRWKQSGLTYTPSGGSATTLTDSGDMVLWLAQSATSNTLTVNMAIDGIIYAMGGFKGNLNGQASTVARATFGDSGNGEHNANNIKSNGMWYYTSNGPVTTLGASTGDGAIYSQAYNTSWAGQIAQDYRDGALFVRGLSGGTWKNWYAIPKFTTTTGGLGSITQPIYINTNGELQTISYTIAKSVPSDAVFTDTNNAVTHTVKTTTKYYVTGTESATTSTDGDTFDTGIYATTTAGQLNATTFKVNEAVTLQWNAIDSSLDFVFA